MAITPKSEDKYVEKCSTAQSFIRTEMSTYWIGTLEALQILTKDDEVENWSLSSFFLAVHMPPGARLDFLLMFAWYWQVGKNIVIHKKRYLHTLEKDLAHF